ncbi:hypothetical protein CEP50_08460 [Actinopolyspora mortivallis]|uniref:Uncharacterized protein n=1 Tax=Actinopolyspora mortivallis TaxID=33906 RepID=A0A2T0GXF9_ACTMO|nr:hypothetical protein CEP50_08460 [Actinopolyspora mortivallis]
MFVQKRANSTTTCNGTTNVATITGTDEKLIWTKDDLSNGTSKIDFSATVNVGTQTVELTADITSGILAGKTITAAPTDVADIEGSCLDNSLKSVSLTGGQLIVD